MGKKTGNHQWVRVRGANLQNEHEVRHVAAENRFKDPAFKEACEKAGIPVTKRQARKWNNNKGAAYKLAHKIKMNGFAVQV